MTDSSDELELLIVTGMSGAGRSTAANALEDLGWYVVDNLPPQMLRPLADLGAHTGSAIPRIAAVVDVRGGRLFEDAQEVIAELHAAGRARVLFLDATDAALVRRFEQVRRPHPLQGDGTIIDGIASERVHTRGLRELSDQVIDTSDLNVHQLAMRVAETFSEASTPSLKLTVVSFGFKYGAPSDADMLADMRFIPNPYWIPELAHQTGIDAPVRDYVLSQPGVTEFVDHYVAALASVVDGYRRENKRHATIGVGCTGGKHRSVAITEEVAARLRELPGVSVTVRHRDLGRE
ncbi:MULTISPECIES: RNase adapter RapZ [unclassified Salinibacterium]|uniref:RNase adapter RapZ n=1 Tax=unclassified Salinibacterium TaxID=2632331 RepID=UPI0014227643|nr:MULTISPECIES: RNase adapter RapZ [unclassified Salinibacterium]